MRVREKNLNRDWLGPDDAPELTEEVFARAQISVGGKVIRAATGTLTKAGRPPIGDEPKQQVTLRLPRDVLRFFKAGGPGWQTRISAVLERHAHKGREQA
jgi:uncharacterized protein (DUF4415 family)